MNEQQPRLSCRDACGASVGDEEEALAAAWSYLSITRSWRCPACGRCLAAAARIEGRPAAPADMQDTIDPRSRGHLKKETASTIAPPSLAP